MKAMLASVALGFMSAPLSVSAANFVSGSITATALGSFSAPALVVSDVDSDDTTTLRDLSASASIEYSRPASNFADSVQASSVATASFTPTVARFTFSPTTYAAALQAGGQSLYVESGGSASYVFNVDTAVRLTLGGYGIGGGGGNNATFQTLGGGATLTDLGNPLSSPMTLMSCYGSYCGPIVPRGTYRFDILPFTIRGTIASGPGSAEFMSSSTTYLQFAVVPEPSAWALAVIGFLIAGISLRHPQRSNRAAARA